MERLRAMQTQFFGMALVAPEEYSGRSISQFHHGRGITKVQFAHFVEHLFETLKDIGVDEANTDSVIKGHQHLHERDSAILIDAPGAHPSTRQPAERCRAPRVCIRVIQP